MLNPLQTPAKRSLLSMTLIVVGIASLLVATLFIFITLALTQWRAEDQATKRLNELIDSTSVMASVACFANDATLAAETANALLKHSDVLSISIHTEKQELATASRAQPRLIADHAVEAVPLTRAIHSPFDPTEKIGEILVTPNWPEIQKTVRADVRHAATILILLATGIVGVIGAVITWLVVRPVKSISDRLHAINASAGETLHVPVAHAENELGRLVEDINDLLGRFQVEHESQLQRVVTEKLRLAAEVFKNSQEGIMITNRQNEIVTVNRAFSQITGYSEDEVIGKNPRILTSGRQNKDFYTTMWNALLDRGFWKGELWNRCKTGEIIPKWFSINTVTNEAGEIVNHVAIFSDISERKKAEERIEFLAHHDPLTKLPNRVLLRDRFANACASALRAGSGITLMFIDLDNFKNINDSFGHHAGDKLLTAMVERLQGFIREADTISRQGGDEFIVMLANIREPEIVARIAEKMLNALAAPFTFEENTFAVSASIGISLFPDDGKDFDSLLRNADAAMYDAKSRGKNAYRFFTEAMSGDAKGRLRLQVDLRNALKNAEFRLHYQAQIDLASNEMIGVEALLRWHHPTLGEILPAHFIPLAEDCGLIVPIGQWVLEEACRQGAQWRASGLPPLMIAVNISALQFNRGDLIEIIENALRRSGLPAGQLEIEITESVLMRNLNGTLDTIQRLKQLGVQFAIDDFGTGYSSLSSLKTMKVNKLKIDQSFVRDIDHDADDLAIVRAIIQLGQTLQLRVIAEGVETVEQLDILRKHGCDEVQGYYFGRPLPPESLEALLMAGKTGA